MNKCQMSNVKCQMLSKGFTLIEIITVMAVLGVVGGLVGSVFVGSLRGTNKTNNLVQVRQNGNYALTQMANIIRVAKSATCTSSPLQAITVTLMDKPVGFTDQVTFSCDWSNAANGITVARTTTSGDSSTDQLISNTSTKVTACSFICSPSDTDVKTIKINFRLDTPSDSLFAESKAPITFNTTISLRNAK